jgi:hypothetical protein
MAKKKVKAALNLVNEWVRNRQVKLGCQLLVLKRKNKRTRNLEFTKNAIFFALPLLPT